MSAAALPPGLDLVGTEYGRASLDRLKRLIERFKDGDPLQPVTVVVPTNHAGLAARRLLGSGALGRITPAGNGLAGVTFVTVYRLAELLGAPLLAGQGRRPVSTPLLAAVTRTILAEAPGVFDEVVEHPATERALVRAHRELSDLDDGELDRLADQSGRAADVVRIHRGLKARLRDAWYDEFDLLRSAVDSLENGSPVLRDLGAIVVHLPQDISATGASLIRSLSGHTPVTISAAFTGDKAADAALHTTLDRLGLGMAARAAGTTLRLEDRPVEVPHADRVVAVSDADDEVRGVLREVVAAARNGVPLERMAVLYPVGDPYARLVHEHFSSADVPHNGGAVRTLGESVTGRSLLSILALADHDFRRADVLALLSSAPILGPDGRLATVAAWERTSRAAGIVSGADEWRTRLARFVEDRNDDMAAEEARDGSTSVIARLERERDWAESLLGFITALIDDVDESASGTGWRAKREWAQGLINTYLGGERRRQRWPSEEIDAAEKVEGALDRLAALDEVEPDPSLAVFRRTLELELESGLARVGSFGNGVLVGPVDMVVGLDLDRVFILGLAEGTFPSRGREDSLLPDNERSAAGTLALRGERINDERRHFLIALASANDESVLYFPRGDLRRSTERIASRWLLDTIEQRSGERPASDELSPDLGDWYRHVASFEGGLKELDFPATDQEFRLRSLFSAGHDADLHEQPAVANDPAFLRGLDLIEARASGDFTRFDGNLNGLDIESPTDPHAIMSPTRLEQWAVCPFAYLVRHVLKVEAIEAPERLVQVSALDKGSIIHDALDEFLVEVLDDPASIPAPDQPWSIEQRERLQQIGTAICQRYEDRGLTGRSIYWRRDRDQLLRDLDLTLAFDDGRRAELNLVPTASELGFGVRDAKHPVLVYELGNGSTIRLRGSADRIDRSTDGLHVVTDYKTGSDKSFSKLGEENPDQLGTKLQLPIYAAAVRAFAADPSARIRAEYWFNSEVRGFKRVGYEVTDRVRQRFDEVLTTIDHGISQGIFPAHPEEPKFQFYVSCWFCDPDGLGTADAHRRWERKKHTPALDLYRNLVEPPETLDV